MPSTSQKPTRSRVSTTSTRPTSSQTCPRTPNAEAMVEIVPQLEISHRLFYSSTSPAQTKSTPTPYSLSPSPHSKPLKLSSHHPTISPPTPTPFITQHHSHHISKKVSTPPQPNPDAARSYRHPYPLSTARPPRPGLPSKIPARRRGPPLTH